MTGRTGGGVGREEGGFRPLLTPRLFPPTLLVNLLVRQVCFVESERVGGGEANTTKKARKTRSLFLIAPPTLLTRQQHPLFSP